MKRFIISLGKGLALTAFWVALWWLLSLAAGSTFIPSPPEVALRLAVLAREGEFYLTVGNSLLRILLGFVLGVVCGTLLAFLSRPAWMESLLSPLRVIIKATPVASFIILAWIWLERAAIPVFIGALMVVPVVWHNVAVGLDSAPDLVLQFAKAYRLTPWQTWRTIRLPALLPHFASALLTGTGLVWKAGVAAEVLCQPPLSIGGNLYAARQYFDTVDLFAWTLVVILISLLLEKTVAAFLNKTRQWLEREEKNDSGSRSVRHYGRRRGAAE